MADRSKWWAYPDWWIAHLNEKDARCVELDATRKK